MDFERMKNALVAAAERAGLAQYEIFAQSEENINAEALKDDISVFSFGSEGGICFRCIVDGKMGYASGELMTEDAMEDLVRAAISNARCIDNEDEVFIFEGSPAYAKVTLGTPELAEASEIRKACWISKKQPMPPAKRWATERSPQPSHSPPRCICSIRMDSRSPTAQV